MESNAIPTRKTERIEVSVCPRCYAAIPTEKLATHIEWHVTKENK